MGPIPSWASELSHHLQKAYPETLGNELLGTVAQVRRVRKRLQATSALSL